MKPKNLLILLSGVLLGGLIGLVIIVRIQDLALVSQRQLPPTVGSEVKNFKLDDVNGKPMNLHSMRGKPGIINFWATWCPPCKEEFPLLQNASLEYNNQLWVIAVNHAEDRDSVAKFIDEVNVTFPVLLDTSGVVSDMYFVHNFPMTFFIDSDGILQAQHLGQLTEDVLERYLPLIGIEK